MSAPQPDDRDLTAVHPPPAGSGPGTQPPPSSAAAGGAPAPRRLGRYALLQLLGRGGMGEVWRARDVTLEREVALKLLAPGIANDAESRARFLREARAAARVNHPGVVTVLDADEAEGQVYMALELVRGGDALALLRSQGGRLAEVSALELGRDLAEGLVALEAAGIVHRDIKPANVFLTAEGRAKLGDLGLARSEAGEDKITRTGLVLGTPAYMPPEQAEGLAGLDTRADIYSLGATLFHLLTGRAPYVGPSLMAVMTQVLTAPVPDPQALAPGLSPATSRLVKRCLAKLPEKRFASARELLAALEPALRGARAAAAVGPPAGRPIRAPSGRSPQVAAPTERAIVPAPPRRVTPTAVGVLVAAPLVGIGLAWLANDRRPTPPPPPERRAPAQQPDPQAASPPAEEPPATPVRPVTPRQPGTADWRPLLGNPGAPDRERAADLLPRGPSSALRLDAIGRGEWLQVGLQDVTGQALPCQVRWTFEGVDVRATDRALAEQGFTHPAGIFCELGLRSRSDEVWEGARLTGEVVWVALQFDRGGRLHVLARAVDDTWRPGSLTKGVPGLKVAFDAVIPIDPARVTVIMELTRDRHWRAKLESNHRDRKIADVPLGPQLSGLTRGPVYAWTNLGNWAGGEGRVGQVTVETRSLP